MMTSTEKSTGRTASAVASAMRSNVERAEGRCLEAAINVFEDDDGGVDEDAEVDGADGDQIRGTAR